MKEIRVFDVPEQLFLEFEDFAGFLRIISSSSGMAGVIVFKENEQWTYAVMGGVTTVFFVKTDIEPKTSYIQHKFMEDKWEFVEKPASEGQSLTISVSRVKKPDWWKKQEEDNEEKQENG